MALFAGTYFDRKQYAFAIPVVAMFISDLIIGLHANMPAVYLSFALTVVLGMAIRKKVSVRSVFMASVASAMIFFLITNFSSWLAMSLYPKNFMGLIECYIAGLAFFRDTSSGFSFFLNDFLGTTFFSAVFYGSFYLIQMRFPVLDRSRF
jgi:predicted secreted protein